MSGGQFELKNGNLFVLAEAAGGVYNGAQLRLICDVADDVSVFLKVTEDQRIGFMVPKEKLLDLHSKLSKSGILLKHYRNHSILSPKACLGELCNKCQQDALGDAIEISPILNEKFKESFTALTIGMNGCSTACVASATDDIHVIGEESGYKVLIGGRSSGEPKLAEFLIDSIKREKIGETICNILETFSQNKQENEGLAEVVGRIGLSPFKQNLKSIGVSGESADSTQAHSGGDEEDIAATPLNEAALEEKLQAEESAAPAEESAAPAEESVAPAEESAAPAEESAAPAEESAAPAEESAALAEESAALAEESAAPAEESAAPAEESAAPAEESAAPAEESAAPAEESAAPAEESAAPAEEEIQVDSTENLQPSTIAASSEETVDFAAEATAESTSTAASVEQAEEAPLEIEEEQAVSNDSVTKDEGESSSLPETTIDNAENTEESALEVDESAATMPKEDDESSENPVESPALEVAGNEAESESAEVTAGSEASDTEAMEEPPLEIAGAEETVSASVEEPTAEEPLAQEVQTDEEQTSVGEETMKEEAPAENKETTEEPVATAEGSEEKPPVEMKELDIVDDTAEASVEAPAASDEEIKTASPEDLQGGDAPQPIDHGLGDDNSVSEVGESSGATAEIPDEAAPIGLDEDVTPANVPTGVNKTSIQVRGKYFMVILSDGSDFRIPFKTIQAGKILEMQIEDEIFIVENVDGKLQVKYGDFEMHVPLSHGSVDETTEGAA
ncbi:hypothetical protein QEJ31_15625 [Pigmentibacter sp. JX0631]|uniref:hypothetical protein n=1 Tax=Pigmentibacter sp. JX0631 TaxID=2976982 RepID=UPI002468C93A|nr:hypothetical protein [Pigmentibacter sp. JX0631]WGL59962.1 hypothetical protein QEJ31_15625 [Pigmentibacter sp. JX0631]